MPTVWIPPLMRSLAGGQEHIAVPGETVREVIEALDARHPGLKERLCQDDRLSPGLTLTVDGVMSHKGLRQRLNEDSEVHFVPAIGGGSGPIVSARSHEQQIQTVIDVLKRNLQSIWDGDVEAYRETTAEDVSFFEWYISPQRIDGIDFHLRELSVHGAVVGGGEGSRVEHEILQPRVQIYGDTAIVSYTLLIRAITGSGAAHRSHNESRVFYNTGSADAPNWKLVHCHKSPVATAGNLNVLRT
jgi:sulfur-carrier protein